MKNIYNSLIILSDRDVFCDHVFDNFTGPSVYDNEFDYNKSTKSIWIRKAYSLAKHKAFKQVHKRFYKSNQQLLTDEPCA